MTPRGCLSNSAFSLVELMVGVAIIAILAALILSVLSKTKQTAQGTSCVNNLKQLSPTLLRFLLPIHPDGIR